ncbi:MAG: GNAT family N-acetyltransferase [Acidobacteria bacterium]|nr:MAG: GNAT family N-acetyltransferase [Acidobacteriota bacterium]REK02462.1 MAG: GNAT family N-acetyltransferase [Acidobacteriota bacterium]REK13736.1 MAG: GNAT family N-acetyltransferase [Acidobacteriota bacterium]REK41730.1 MAG: GNAT family N-acetyltransferase [Acidobacteriota bacterium]
MVIIDKALSKRLEQSEARANADFVETRARIEPESGAEWINVGGAYAMFDGIDSPLTQTFGLGLFEDATNDQLEKIEEFYRERKAHCFHEVSPLADQSILSLLGERGYRPIEVTSVLVRELKPGKARNENNGSGITTRVIEPGEHDLWARTAAAGWATEHPGLSDFMFSFGRIGAQCPAGYPYVAEIGGEPVAAGSLIIYDDVCILAGASTIPEARRKGAQTALLADRLQFSAEKGCTLAMMGAAPGSQSQKNAQKNGFEIAYTRIKWQLFK